ncbi:hypothetical protein C8F04DRAFT_1397621 [Mycena alexandri]|uniref:Uncharacterized protein n=1 Tax=Mycena alexandri TaxID=1745969 RepID=A0AAD6SQT0_9AGAR|nr:hypothetical protein C8F04DRAFT_1397621 [Mycena alexandri]
MCGFGSSQARLFFCCYSASSLFTILLRGRTLAPPRPRRPPPVAVCAAKMEHAHTRTRPAAKRKPSGPKSEKSDSIELTIVLVENTKEVNRGEYVLPTATKMRKLHSYGYIRYISFPSTSSPSDVSHIISETFSTILNLDPFRLLCVISKGQGTSPALRMHAVTANITLRDLQMASTTHRQAKEYKKCVYIAAPREADNLPYDCDEPMSTHSEETEEFPESPTKFTAQATSEESAQADTSAGPSGESKSSKDEVPSHSPISDVFRLLVNMHRPASTKTWWPAQTTEPYAGALEAVPMIDRQLHRTEGSTIGALSIDAILSLFEHDLFPQLVFLLELGDPAAHEKNFRLGAHGLEPIVNILYHFHRFLKGPHIYLPDAHLKGYVDQVDITLVDRENYDPPDVAGVRKILRTRRTIFATADEDERFTVLNLSVSRDDPETFVIRVNKDFYIDDEGNIVSDECLLVGEHGIDGFMALVDELLDVLPVSHGSYEALYEALVGTCGALNRRMTNYNKSHSRKKRQEKSAPPESHSLRSWE